MQRRFLFAVLAVFTVCCLPVTGCGKRETLDSYILCCEYFPEEETLHGEMDVTVHNRTDTAFSQLPFSLYANCYGSSSPPPALFYEGESTGETKVTALTGASFTAEEENTILCADLPSLLYPDESVTLHFSFDTHLPKANARLGIGEHVVTLAGFYPILCAYDGGFKQYPPVSLGDPTVSETAVYDVKLTVPSSYVAAGATLSKEEEGKRVYTFQGNVREAAFVLGEDLSRIEGSFNGKPVTYWYFEDGSPETVLRATCDALAFFEKEFGAYPYDSFTLAQADLPYGGVEYPGLAMLSPMHPNAVAEAAIHEVAHQWWYADVGSDSFMEAWQDEGLSEYSVALFYGSFPSYGDYRTFVQNCEKSYRTYFSVSSQVNGKADTRMSRPLTSFSGEYEYRCIAYDKGVVLFDRLRDTLGEKKLLRALRQYAQRYAGKLASPADLISCFDDIRAEELFASFLEGKCVI